MIKTPIQPPTRQDLLIFQGLQRALVEKKAFVKIDFKALNKIGSPFFNPWENAIADDFGFVAGNDDCRQSDDGDNCFDGFDFGVRFFDAVFVGTVYAKPCGQADCSQN